VGVQGRGLRGRSGGGGGPVVGGGSRRAGRRGGVIAAGRGWRLQAAWPAAEAGELDRVVGRKKKANEEEGGWGGPWPMNSARACGTSSLCRNGRSTGGPEMVTSSSVITKWYQAAFACCAGPSRLCWWASAR
jgi:hypothetical protein